MYKESLEGVAPAILFGLHLLHVVHPFIEPFMQ